MTIMPIETRYAGCRFRSRLEARWAVFFDALGIRWEYEPQGYALPTGPYLPDFQLFGLGGDAGGGPIWFEVKPPADDPSNSTKDDKRWNELCDATGLSLIVAFGMPRPDGDLVWTTDTHRGGWMELFAGTTPDGDDSASCWDNGRAFCTCCVCGRLGITFEARAGRVCPHGGDDRSRSADDERILAAYVAARSARFEHRESGARPGRAPM